MGRCPPAPWSSLHRRSRAFDAVAAPAAIVDPSGEVLAVNDAWQLVVDLMAGAPPPADGATVVGVGEDLVGALSGGGAAIAPQLRRVLAGDRALFEADCCLVGPLADQWVQVRASAAPSESGGGAVVILADIHARKQLEAQLADMAGIDRRTGLPDRGSAIALLARQSSVGLATLVVVDLAAIPGAVAGIGAPAVDQLVAQVVARLHRTVRTSDVVCRLSAEQLVVVAPSLDPHEVAGLCERLRRRCSAPYQVGAQQVTLVVGVAWRTVTAPDDVRVALEEAQAEARPAGAPAELSMVGPSGWSRARSMVDEAAALTVDEVVRARTAMLDAVGEAVLALDPHGFVTHLNGAAERLYGWTNAEAQGHHITEVGPADLTAAQVADIVEAVVAGGSWAGDLTITTRTGGPFAAQVTAAPLYVGGEVAAVITSTVDVSARLRSQPPGPADDDAWVDPVTGLASNRAFSATLASDLAEVADREGGGTLTLVLLEVDDLPRIQRAGGGLVVEQLVRAAARSLRGAVHDGDRVGRLSAGGLAVTCSHLRGTGSGLRFADDLRAAIRGPFEADGGEWVLRSSAGISLGGHPSPGPEEVLRRADTALQHAKRQQGTSRAYDQAMDVDQRRRDDLDHLVRRAVAGGPIPLAYQAITRLDDGTVVGAEALLRLTDANGVPVAPLEAFDAAERCGLAPELGRQVLAVACDEAARWQRFLPERTLSIAVNLSAEQFRDRNTAYLVAQALAAADLAPSRLTLEIAESVLVEDPAWSARQLAVLKMQGVQLAADDYGTGHTSLLHLKRFPLDLIKVDLSLVAGLPDSPEDSAIVFATIRVAEALDLQVVAEGVENERQREELHRLGCEFGQGYLWSTAVAGDEFLKLVLRPRTVFGRGAVEAARQLDEASPGRRPASTGEVEELDAVLRSLAHEIRTPLTVAMGYASLLEAGDDEEQAMIATSIRKATERINHLLGNLEDVRLIDHGRLELDAEVLDLADLVEATVVDLRSIVRVPLEVQRADLPALVDADPTRIAQVVANLVSNAAKFVRPGSPVVIRVDVVGEWAEVSVSDDGPGVDEADLGLIYRKYGRADAAHPGSGLGLYLARGTARAHGGDIMYRRGRPGSTFTLTLPRSADGA
nr:EAL domain-containing protein [Aquihabitans sp. G128]